MRESNLCRDTEPVLEGENVYNELLLLATQREPMPQLSTTIELIP